jgi:branched-chain amino acid transport system permease protein
MFFLQILLNSLVIGTQVMLLSVSLYLIYSVAKIFHLALGAIGVVLSYVLYFALRNNLSIFFSVILVLFSALILGWLSCVLLESMAKKKEELFGLLTSFALGIILESLMAIFFGTDGKFLLTTVLPVVSFGGLHITIPGLITIIMGVILSVIFLILTNKTPWGRSLRSIAENAELSSSLTSNPARIRFYVFLIASLLAGFVGIMTTLNTALTPQSGFNLIILAFVSLLVGGVVDLQGTILASYIIVLTPELIVGLSNSSWSVSASWKMVIVFMLALILLVWRPNGFLGRKQRLT